MKSEAMLAKDIIAASRRRIMQLCPSLTQSIHLLKEMPSNHTMHTDGTHFFYNAQDVIRRFRSDHDSIAYALLHLTLHCLLGHIGARSVEDLELFDAIADHEVHCMIKALCPTLSMEATPKALQYDYFPLSQSYQIARDNLRLKKSYLKEQLNNQVDLHGFWNLKLIPLPQWQSAGQKLSERLGNPEDTYFRHHGRIAGGWQKTLAMAANKSTRDYQTLLSRFLKKQLKEAPSTQDIDPMWYHFGLDYLGDIPIIEPAEEEDLPSSGALAIALDTSGSCDGEVCQRFLRELVTILESLEEISSFEKIILLQCDTEIQEERCIHQGDDWESILANFLPKGFGGTDFCPVFERLAEETDLSCLIYLSDGCGDFPEEAPKYPTLFLLDSSDTGELFMPDWVESIPYNP